jgi:hypothetical protein
VRTTAKSRHVAEPVAAYGSDRGEAVLYRAPDAAGVARPTCHQATQKLFNASINLFKMRDQ